MTARNQGIRDLSYKTET